VPALGAGTHVLNDLEIKNGDDRAGSPAIPAWRAPATSVVIGGHSGRCDRDTVRPQQNGVRPFGQLVGLLVCCDGT
jgi:hypothetical protein